MKFDLPNYDKAFMKFLETVIQGFINVDPLLGKMGHRTSAHAGPIRNVRGEKPLDQDMPPIHSTTAISLDAIKNTDLDAITTFFYTLAIGMREELAKEFFKGIREITDATGQVIDARGEPLSRDHINQLYEKTEIEFDENGEPIKPTLIIHPDMVERFKKIEETPEQRQQFIELTNRKREEFYAKQRNRRLS